MRIEISGNRELTIYGNIKSVEDYLAIRDAVNGIVAGGAGDILLRIPESFSMPSSVIGFLLQAVNQKRCKIAMLVGDNNLYELLDEMNLLPVLHATKGA
ncbi:hypothetical protein L4X63_13535 [Geomonas sp. Red32]|uniref:hypothetical protein n=1 Tax=Geomonas sp. Red32 TaxID=2912856 RepID=UPI00202CE306|nr:hypothetical protein [Geomonas sp. Red32]MCM0082617.1 hypothetical protein [Geomonas sp. Red32]